jgi:hypothetical protein
LPIVLAAAAPQSDTSIAQQYQGKALAPEHHRLAIDLGVPWAETHS